MTTHESLSSDHQKLLDQYLSRFDRALDGIPPAEKALLVTEMKNRIVDTYEKSSDSDLKSILISIGQPEQVASRHRLDRGLSMVAHAKSPAIKWIVLGFLGFVALLFIFSAAVIWKFTPIVDIDEKTGTVSLLGGTLHVSGDVNQLSFDYDSALEETLDAPSAKKLDVNFTNGKFKILNSNDKKIHLKCKTSGAQKRASGALEAKEDTVFVNLSSAGGAKCQLRVPKGLLLSMTGTNGKVHLEMPRYPANITLKNGMVNINPDPDLHYTYKTDILQGSVDTFVNSTDKDALEIRISMINGLIGNLEEDD